MIVIAAFFILLLLGIPISMVVLGASTLGVLLYSSTPLQIVVQQMFSGLNNYVLLAIPFFIISGTIASRGSTAKYLTQVMTILFGRLRGGSVIATIASCAFFAAISGSSFATIVAIGSIMLPALAEQKYPDRMSIGVITAGGSIGVLIPPSAPMIALCVALGSSVGRQFIAGVIPGLVLALAWAVYTFAVCSVKKYGEPVRYTAAEARGILVKAIPALLYPVIVLGSIYGGLATPTESAAISIVYVVLIELFVYRTSSVKELLDSFTRSLTNSAGITFIISASQLLTWFITTQRLDRGDDHLPDGVPAGHHRYFLRGRLLHGAGGADDHSGADPVPHAGVLWRGSHPFRHHLHHGGAGVLRNAALWHEPVCDHEHDQAGAGGRGVFHAALYADPDRLYAADRVCAGAFSVAAQPDDELMGCL